MNGSEIRSLAEAVSRVPTLEQPGLAWQLGHLQSTVIRLLNRAAEEADRGSDCVPITELVSRMTEYVDAVAVPKS